jgi:hypothetical protein
LAQPKPKILANDPGVSAAYALRATELERRAEHARRLGDRLSAARLATFLLAVGALVLWDFLDGAPARLALGFVALLAVGFFVLVAVHDRVLTAEKRHRAYLSLVREGLHRLARRWDELPGWSEAVPVTLGRDHPYAGDLDLFGRGSIAALCGPVTTAPGRRILAEWLLNPAAADELLARQDAVRELAPALDARLELAALARQKEPPSQRLTNALVAWAEEPTWLLQRRGVALTAWLLPSAFLALAVLHFAAGTGPLWLIPLAAQLLLARKFGHAITVDFRRAEGAGPALESYAQQIRLLRGWSVAAPRLVALMARLEASGASSDERLRGLVRTLELVESRRSLVYKIFSPLLLLDLHVHRALERWKAESGSSLGRWLEALGEIEALAALSCLAHDHPDWSFPVPAEEPRLTARALAHPLLVPGVAVRNDVEVGPVGTFLLVTGSNMSGKSTLLRALGMNVVLASAGAPVCAAEMRLPAVSLHTSIRVQDSLEEGVSLFMAELLALARTVAAARKAGPDEKRVLYLLDEVLQGTNSGDRRVAARTVLGHLLEAGAIGAVTTHDLALAAAPQLEARAVPVHFTETVIADGGAPRLVFDYQLRPGLATTRNALVLLEMVGLGPVQTSPASPEPGTQPH